MLHSTYLGGGEGTIVLGTVVTRNVAPDLARPRYRTIPPSYAAASSRVGGGFILWEESRGPDTRGEGLREILYQAYGLRGFSRFANLLAIAHLRICESLAPKKNKNRKFANAQLAIVEIWDTLFQ